MYPQALPTQAQISIDRLEMLETGTYNNMFARPFGMNTDGHLLNDLSNRVQQSSNAAVSPELLKGLAGTIIQPTGMVEHQIPMANGWNERRVRFMMYVTVHSSTSNQIRYIFQGYTSHMGVGGGINNMNAGGGAQYDPNMEFYINSFIRMNTRMVPGPTGMQPEEYMTEAVHVLNGQLVQDVTVNDAYTMRPNDLFTGVQSQYLESAWNGYGSGKLNDTRVRMQGDSFTSKRTNCLPSNYMSKMISSYQESKDLLGFGQGADDLYSRARDLSFEPSPTENAFIRQISNVRGMPNQTRFTLANLAAIDPMVTQGKMTFRSLGAAVSNKMHNAGSTAFWDANDNESIWAAMLSNAVPALMMELLIGQISFFSTNDTINGSFVTNIGDSKVMTSAAASRNLAMFKNRLENEILSDLVYRGFRYQLNMSVNVFSESIIDLKIDHGPLIRYCTPSFCDGLIAPVFTSRTDTYVGMVNNCEVLVNSLPTQNSLTVNSMV